MCEKVITENKNLFRRVISRLIFCHSLYRFRVPRLSFNKRTIDAIPRPELNCVDLLYSEEEIWIRLQIREFIFRFGGLYDFDSRLLNSLQNVQGDWKIKRLGAYIVWKFLVILSTSGQFELSQSSLTEETIPQRARKILNDWMMEKKLFRLYLDTASRHQALLDILNVEGMTGKRWQDIAELLALADLQDLPIPTSRDIQNINANVTKDENDMEIDDDDVQELEKKIRRFQKSGRSLALLSSPDELRMIHMLLELLLFETVTRQSLNIPGTGSKTKEVKDRELELKKYSKEYLVEESKKKAQRSNLLTRISQLKVIKGKEEDLKTAQIDLDLLETAIRDDRMELEKKKLELDIYAAKARKRMEPIGYDKFDNEYWIFNDVLDHLSHASDFRNSEPYWAYGVIIIGPGFNSTVGEESNKWWYIKGKKNLSMLADWIKQNPKDKEENKQSVESFVNKIHQRIDHLTSLEWAVYGTGFFS
ncbi:MAG: hypothetical protein EXX96DRAFT_565561 [Benjaminiella poitrasii]|nr:MAG: hypothetical protein EXX96DRAFT_565561 [Benjaminiella poitrasii]